MLASWELLVQLANRPGEGRGSQDCHDVWVGLVSGESWNLWMVDGWGQRFLSIPLCRSKLAHLLGLRVWQ